MTKIICFFVLILAFFLLAGCVVDNDPDNTTPASCQDCCEYGSTEGCDRSCLSDLDCQESPAGCINVNEYFDNKGIEISIRFMSCRCVNGLCTED